ncbi:MAG: diguanylate cyclase [Aquisalimonadaceae bacterium]
MDKNICNGLSPGLAERILEHTTEAVGVLDADLHILWVNSAYSRITGYSLEEIQGKTPKVLRSGHHDSAFYAQLTDKVFNEGAWSGEIWRRRKNGEIFPAMLNVNAIRDSNGVITHIIDMFSDIGDYKNHQSRVEFLVSHDALTELPNRYLLMDRLASTLRRAERRNQMMALLFIDLDNLKMVNDTYGHLAGDTLLRVAAERLKLCVRESDTVARVGGDEYIILLDEIRNPEDVDVVATKILDALSSPAMHGAHCLTFSASIGISCYPRDGDYPERLLANADAAMYKAKETGGNTWRMWTPNFDSDA